MKNGLFQYLKNRACHQNETWYGYKKYQVYVTHTSFVWPFFILGEITGVPGNVPETLTLDFFQRLWH